ncbi:HAMP domain-containing sensor histidine kinase [Paenibacillus whitsoniae]|uniref:Signal transduction histidine-protein kinase ArlS n=1 Tax=Paenibacillus whitsoniae TaxID=2496558 RepID=A0A3S0CQH4_9BACL|nr:HAMP domain-containing histidine kinase [Paenibacillus whitsoniae]RTE03550.1 HAMP domain-containing histidine kinase [Paenibacillus whitsoniae]
MKKWVLTWIRRLPIKWKLMLGAALLIFLLFASYNFAQYHVLKQLMMKQEEDKIQVGMMQLQDFLQNKSANDLQLPESRSFIEKLTGKNQFARILDDNGKALLTIANHFNPEWVAPRRADAPQLYDTTFRDFHLLIYRSPLNTASFQGTLELGSNLETFDYFSERLLWVMLIGGVLAVFISVLSGLAIARTFMRPIRALASTIRSVKKKGLTVRVDNIQNGDELSGLAMMFNDLMGQLEISFKQQKQFVEDASHELRTPITILEGHLSLLNRWGKSDPAVLDESLEASLYEVRRLKKLVQELLTLTKAESNQYPLVAEPILAVPSIRETVKRFEILNPDFQFIDHLSTIEEVQLLVSPMHLEQILMIVLDNAVKYSVHRKTIEIEGVCLKRTVQIRVQDHGIGIPAADLPHIFDRFYRVDKARNQEIGGTGLGLAIAKQLVQQYQGTIAIESEEGKGSCVELTFPLVPAAWSDIPMR